MKKLVSVLLVAVLLAGMMPVMGAAVAEDSYAVVNSGNEFGVRLRLGPGTTYDIMNTLPSGTTVTILESGTVWSRIQAGTQVGYMMSKFLVSGGTTSSFKVETKATVYAGNGLRTWLRSSANGKRLGLYSDGTPVSVITKGDTWSKIMIGSSVGYMMTKYLKFGGSGSSAPSTSTQAPAPVLTDITSLTLNYPYPLVGDTLKPILTPANATCLYAWEVLNDDGSVLRSLGTNPVCTLGQDLLGSKIRLTITGTGDFEGEILSVISQPVTAGEELTGVVIRNNTAPESKAPAIGDVLEAVTAPSSANVTYSWRISGEEKSTGSTYTVKEADKGKKIQLYVKAESPVTGEAVSAYTGKVTKAPEITGVTMSTNSPVVGKAITASPVPSTVTATYTWYVDGVAKTTASKYTPTARDLGKKITVKAVDANGISAIGEAEQPVSDALISSVSINNASPAVGEVLTATVKPAAANKDGLVTFTWYVDDAPVTPSGCDYNQYIVAAADQGKRIYVVAEGDGTYGGKATSGTTKAVTEMTKLLGVKLDTTTPVLDATITATVTPSSANDSGNLVFVWYKNNVPFATTTSRTSPAMTEQEVGKKISVRVSGSTPYYGEVESTQTNAVKGEGQVALSGLVVVTEGAQHDATAYQPRIGETLTAVVKPASAASKVTYSWFLGDTWLAEGETFTVPEKVNGKSTAGKSLKVIARDLTGLYTGKITVTTATIYAPAKKDKPLNIDLSLIVPKAGELPISSISGDNYTATIKWDAPMDSFGRFKKDTDYTATISVKPATKYYVDKNKINAPDSNSFSQIDLTTIKASYSVAGDAPVSIYSITGLEAPVVGATPDNTINSTSQFVGYSVKWTDADGNAVSTFKAGEIYTAEIVLEKLEGYTFDADVILNAVDSSLFSVAGASKAVLTGVNTGSDHAVIKATFDAASTETKVILSVDRSSVGVGSSAKLVQCEAYLTNYAGEQSDLKWAWTVDGATSADTKIDSTGLLTIGKDEAQGSTLRITASVKMDGKNYDASASIATTAEGATDSSVITVSFVTFPGSVDVGGNATFAARVDGAKDETILWSINSSTSTINTAGVLTVSKDETADVITVTATSKAHPDKTAVAGIRIIYPDAVADPTLSFSSTVSTAAPGTQINIGADLTAPDQTDYKSKIKFVAGGDAEISLKNNGDGTCTITVGSSAKDGDVVTVSASYVTTSGKTLSISTNFVVVVPEGDMVSITPASANLYQGQQYTLTAETLDGSTVTWSSEDDTIATVDPDTGLVTASDSKVGSVKIIATSTLSGAKAEATITVSVKRTMDVSGSNTSATATFTGFDTAPEVSWSTSDSSVATIDSTGAITLTPGETEMTVSIIGSATYDGITYSDSYTITVPAAP